MKMPLGKLTIVIPVYNEEKTIETLLTNVVRVKLVSSLSKEVIVVNDRSTDNSARVILDFIAAHPEANINYVDKMHNEGKGAAIHAGINYATGDLILIQDADLEYDPDEYNTLIMPFVKHQADVVYGSRFMGGNPHRILFFWHSIGNKLVTLLSNMVNNLNLTDMETCYKVFDASLLKHISLEEKRFGFEPEITAKVSKIPNIRIYEVGISYYGRTYDEGKKINWFDGIRAIYCIFKYGLFSTHSTSEPAPSPAPARLE